MLAIRVGYYCLPSGDLDSEIFFLGVNTAQAKVVR